MVYWEMTSRFIFAFSAYLLAGRLLFLGLKSTRFGIFWEILPERSHIQRFLV